MHVRGEGPVARKKSYNKEWRRLNKAHIRAYEKKYKKLRDRFENRRQIVRELKEINPCDDCGNSFPYYIMDFDHVRGIKEAKIGELVYSSWARFLAELMKCDLVCANCHKRRTWERLNAR